ncbi:MAG: alkaline phosphatase family protein [Pyrinomonas methylaliphatogenes]|nr:alkaline phosphatase family protein [Pyrinomonas methylaliphatogenes]
MRKILSVQFAAAVLLASIVAALFSIAPAARNLGPQNSAPKAKRALVISIDGLDARYLLRADEYGLKIPTLRRLMREGVVAPVIGVYPSVTYPSHTTIVTGATPARHGIVNNTLFEPPPMKPTGSWFWFARDIKADTLWDAAARRGLSVGLVSWPVSTGAGDWNVPEIWSPGKSPFESRDTVREYARPRGLVEEVERADPELFKNLTPDEGDDMRTRFAEYIIAHKRPQLMLVHLFDLDHFEHSYGPFTSQAFTTLEKVDGYIGRLLAAVERAGLLSETAVFIVSDHGFMAISRTFNPLIVLEQAGLVKIAPDADGRRRIIEWRALPYISGGSCAIILRDNQDQEALRRAREAFRPYEQQGILRIIDRSELERLGANPRAAFALEAAEGYAFGGGLTGETITPSLNRGTHGYLPTLPDYRASLIIAGAGLARRGRIDEINMTRIGPTIARLLGLELRGSEAPPIPLE